MASGIDKLIEVAASGVGSVAGPLLAPWRAKRDGKARLIAAEYDAQVLEVRTSAHLKAREHLAAETDGFTGKIELSERINERIEYQEEKRLANIRAVVGQAATDLEDKEVPESEPDHDWTARFFNDVQDVSSEEMQALWGRVLSGQVERPGSTSLRALGILRDLDQAAARLFARLCSACVYMVVGGQIVDARVPSLGGNAGSNALQDFGLGFGQLNRLHEHGLLIPDYNSWRDYRWSILPDPSAATPVLPLEHQGRQWVLKPEAPRPSEKEWRVHGVALSLAGAELSRVVERTLMPEYLVRLQEFVGKQGLRLLDLGQPAGVQTPEAHVD